uniref:ATP-dependent DNA helicase RecQ zinc-binding domain-containing protein n=2 Tax=Glycine subgen. Soja TaxID=1462606 RepID=K7L978_SOYBN
MVLAFHLTVSFCYFFIFIFAIFFGSRCLWLSGILGSIAYNCSRWFCWVHFNHGSYCEKDVDCRRLLQLAHFGEKFNSSTCQKTCDNCLKITSFIENDVREIAKQLVWEKFLSIYFFHPSTYLISF